MNRTLHVVLDTNILVSTMLKKDSLPGTIVDFCLDGLLIPVLDERILNEYSEVLRRPKFKFPEDIVKDFLLGLTSQAIFVEAGTLKTHFTDESDRKFFEVAVEHRKEIETFLVTGNLRHFPSESFVVSPHEMLDIILNDDNGN